MTDTPDITTPTKRHPARRLAGALVVSLVRILVVCLVLVAFVRCTGTVESMAYAPSRDAFDTPAGIEDVDFVSEDGTRLHGWFMPATTRGDDDTQSRRPAVLHVHGNAGNVASHDSFSHFLTRRGFHVFLFDYRGYGRSEDKKPRRHALLADTRAALAYLRLRDDVAPDRVGVLGVSLGGVFALHAAAESPDVRAVATVSAFSTWSGVAHDLVPVLGPLVMPSGLDPAAAAGRLGERPYLVIHGLQDEIIDPRHADILVESATRAGVPATLWTDPRGDHNSMIQTNPEARDRLATFFLNHLAFNPG